MNKIKKWLNKENLISNRDLIIFTLISHLTYQILTIIYG